MAPSEALPTTAGLENLLADLAGTNAYVVPITDERGVLLGNNGDTLMFEVFQRMLADLGMSTTTDRSAADVVVVPPSGALLERFLFPRLLAERLRGLENRPLVIFPSSLYFPTADPSWMFRGRTAETRLILREPRSFEHLTDQWGEALAAEGVRLHLDHDVVASGHRYVPEIIGHHRQGDYTLVAARRDPEQSADRLSGVQPAPRPNRARDALAQAVPYGVVRTTLTRVARRGVNAVATEALLRSLPEGVLESLAGGVAPSRRVAIDVSATQFATFDEYKRAIGAAAAVVTNRLHVGLPAAILGKPVVLVEAGYFKLRGVYEHSLRGLPNATLVIPSAPATN
ncbi:polysaccharide pyruvyl transferase family protein [Micromonospora chersina]|uniref:polysaccharide pyruvyl transferase family protein n=1 Tax=Micromonospora chersina TaxID=47854 RepID=UPI00371BB65D